MATYHERRFLNGWITTIKHLRDGDELKLPSDGSKKSPFLRIAADGIKYIRILSEGDGNGTKPSIASLTIPYEEAINNPTRQHGILNLNRSFLENPLLKVLGCRQRLFYSKEELDKRTIALIKKA